jgi:hypothetical protein
MNDGFLDEGHSDIQNHWMAERICAAHDSPCVGFDYAWVRNPAWDGGQARYYGGTSVNTMGFGWQQDRICKTRVTWNNTNNIDYSALEAQCEGGDSYYG